MNFALTMMNFVSIMMNVKENIVVDKSDGEVCFSIAKR